MREILFRGKTKIDGPWIYGNLLDNGFNNPALITYYILKKEASYFDEFEEVIPETVGQWTGLTDKNGTKVFEGDILELESGDEVAKTLVYWNEELSGFFDKRDFDGDSFSHYAGGLSWISDAELIGNIHII